jgi:hypothetical protein
MQVVSIQTRAERNIEHGERPCTSPESCQRYKRSGWDNDAGEEDKPHEIAACIFRSHWGLAGGP